MEKTELGNEELKRARHDLNNLLTAINGCIDLAIAEISSDTEDAMESLMMAKKATAKAGSIVSTLAAGSRGPNRE